MGKRGRGEKRGFSLASSNSMVGQRGFNAKRKKEKGEEDMAAAQLTFCLEACANSKFTRRKKKKGRREGGFSPLLHNVLTPCGRLPNEREGEEKGDFLPRGEEGAHDRREEGWRI